MSADSGGEKTELPTPKKERDAREKGQVAKSQDVVSTASLASVVAYIWFNGSLIYARLEDMFDKVVMIRAHGEFKAIVVEALTVVGQYASGLMFPILLITVVSALFATYSQIGFMFVIESLQPKLDNISFLSGCKRIFSMKQVVEILKGIVKISFLSSLLYFVIRDSLASYMSSFACGMPCIFAITVEVMRKMLLYTFLAFGIVAGLDFMYQRYSHTKSLMMSLDEVKREMKESEGDPEIKGQRKQLFQEMIMGDGGERAKQGTAVVINPTHFAVVIHYVPDTTPLPVITAKGRNKDAYYLRVEAEKAGVPVFRNVELARALYATAEIDAFIPEELFGVIAEVLVWVAHNREMLYKGPLRHGVIDMDSGDHTKPYDSL